MNVNDLLQTLSLESLAVPCPERTVSGCYIGDLLSWVMAKAKSDNVWVTIMTNMNIVAVATLTDVSCIILTEDVDVDDEILSVAKEKGVNILRTSKTSYEIAAALSQTI